MINIENWSINEKIYKMKAKFFLIGIFMSLLVAGNCLAQTDTIKTPFKIRVENNSNTNILIAAKDAIYKSHVLVGGNGKTLYFNEAGIYSIQINFVSNDGVWKCSFVKMATTSSEVTINDEDIENFEKFETAKKTDDPRGDGVPLSAFKPAE